MKTKAELAAYMRAYRKLKPQVLKPGARALASKTWREKHPDQIRSWKLAHPERNRELDAAAQHARRNAPGRLAARDIRETKERDAGVCGYCSAKGATHIEHCTPLSRGGWNSPDNVIMSCPTCNFKKGTKTILEFAGML